MLLDKKMNYGKFVKEEYLPPRNSRKIRELKDIRHQLGNYNRRKVAFRDDLRGDLNLY